MQIENFIRKLVPSFVINRLEGRPNLQKIITNTGWLFFDKVIRMSIGLLVGVWVARYLGPEKYGVLSYAQAFVALFSTIATLGLDKIIVRNIVKKNEDALSILGSAFILKLFGGFATLGLTVLMISLIRPYDYQTRWIVGIIATGTIFQAFDTIDFWFQSQVKSKYSVYAKNMAFVLVSIVKVSLILIKAPLIAFAWTALVEITLGAIGLIIAYRLKGKLLRQWTVSLQKCKELLKDSWPLILSGFVIMVYMRIDQIMLREMVGEKEVGIYSAAVKLAEVWYFIPSAIAVSVFPSVVKAKETSEPLFYSRIQQYYKLMALLGYAIALPVTFLANWLIIILYSNAYAGAGLMLSILIWAGIFVNLGSARSAFLTAMNWTKIHLVTTILGSLLNITLNWLLIPNYGGVGAAISSVIAYWFAAHGACFTYRPLWKTGFMMTKALVVPIPRRLK